MKLYSEKVRDYLISMVCGEPVVIADICKEETRSQFIDTIKYFIDEKLGWDDKWQVDFNDDYSKIRKTRF